MNAGRRSALSHRRRRVRWFWAAFAVAAFATAFAVHRLYETVRRELQAQSELARVQQEERAVQRVQTATDALRRSTIAALAAFHVEGLAHALRKWDDANARIVGTFRWEPGKGFLEDGATPDRLPAAEAVAALWLEFRAARASAPSSRDAEFRGRGPWLAGGLVPLLNNPAYPPSALGYQSENLDMLAYAGRAVDPWAGWAATRDPAAPWVVWYQPGDGAPVRGCFVDATELVATLRAELGDAQLARLALVPAGAGQHASLASWLPGYALVSAAGILFEEKQGSARFAALAAALLLGLFLVGAAFLAVYSGREIRDAERKTTFVAQVSHELRTPLTSIRMFADMLAEPELPAEKRAKFAATISRESQRLGALIERLLTFNALQQRRAAARVAPVDAAAVVRETLEELVGAMRSAAMRVEFEAPPEPMVALTDAGALKQALLNLADNAVKYARECGVLRVRLAADAREIRIQVSDDGPGIPRELGERAFEPFVQGSQTLAGKTPGVGLGLSIARGLLREAGGDLALVPGRRGAHFEIRLPCASPA